MSEGKQYAIISDLHGNVEAFDTVMAYIDGMGITDIYCLGDVVGYGQGAAHCLREVRRRNIPCIQGNHDGNLRQPRDPRMRDVAVIALDHALTQLTEEEGDFLYSLPTQRIIDNSMVLVHGALTHRDDYILNQDAVRKNMAIMIEQFVGIQVCFFGHSHLGMILGGGIVKTKFPESEIFELDPNAQYLINVGSVGQPRDGIPKASFGIYDTEVSMLTVVRLDYDIDKEKERMQAAGLPDKLWQRLYLGK